MIGYIYETTNNVNGKTYIGQKLSSVFIDNYFGSGVLICKALTKYGKDNFTHRLIAEANTIEELDKLERYYIYMKLDLKVKLNITYQPAVST